MRLSDVNIEKSRFKLTYFNSRRSKIIYKRVNFLVSLLSNQREAKNPDN